MASIGIDFKREEKVMTNNSTSQWCIFAGTGSLRGRFQEWPR